ncbi:hypothetical protein Q5741_08300 [Paenibacillus sp. JX-17]|uniref:Peptidase M48 domain-containing protein n=1 Tax=Paenibacillus lacisoli TaxID=3064525 RepID=A0ABT9CEN2_9BACL|nr:hypothetical protein [Paenibacillus sp. JX-17]MDO7906417.1 hypothetical protein [Paenibacillus sp. JX-17]
MDSFTATRIINELLERANIGVSVQLESVFPGGRLVGGKYGMNSHTITLYTEVILDQCLQLFGTLERAEDYFAVIAAHEIGHAADMELGSLCEAMESSMMPAERSRIALQIEENAWNYALQLIPEIDAVFISTIIDESLAAYREQVQSDIA